VPASQPDESLIPPAKRPPCRRCGANDWRPSVRRKWLLRWAVETVFAVPDVLIFQGESAGWPGREYERWTCGGCGRSVRVARG
jgi:hypothetical protein